MNPPNGPCARGPADYYNDTIVSRQVNRCCRKLAGQLLRPYGWPCRHTSLVLPAAVSILQQVQDERREGLHIYYRPSRCPPTVIPA